MKIRMLTPVALGSGQALKGDEVYDVPDELSAEDAAQLVKAGFAEKVEITHHKRRTRKRHKKTNQESDE